MKTYKVRARIVAEVEFTIKAEDMEHAKKTASVRCNNLEQFTQDPMTGSQPLDIAYKTTICLWHELEEAQGRRGK